MAKSSCTWGDRKREGLLYKKATRSVIIFNTWQYNTVINVLQSDSSWADNYYSLRGVPYNEHTLETSSIMKYRFY